MHVETKSNAKIARLIALLFEGVPFVCLMINILYMHCVIMHDDVLSIYRYHLELLSPLVIDLFFVFIIPMFVVRMKLRIPLYALAYLVSTVYILVNIGYSRYFDTYLPLNLYFEYKNLDGLSDNAIHAFVDSDFIVVLTSSIALFVLWIYYKLNFSNFTLKSAVLMPVILILIGVYPTYLTFYKIEKEYRRQKEFFSDKVDNRSRLTFYANAIHSPERMGLKYGLFLDAFFYAYSKGIRVDKDKLQDYSEYVRSSNYGVELKNERKNIIIILVESLSSFPINQRYLDGEEITPVLNQLAKDGDFFPRMVSQTQLGESSDGQFTYLTGLLPLRGTVTINEINVDSLASIPNLLPYYFKRMVIPTTSEMWSQKAMCKKYGFDELYTEDEYCGRKDGWLTDKQLFEFADSLDNSLVNVQPFFSVILTSSMHSPYKHKFEPNVEHSFPNDYSSELEIYLQNTSYTDKYLGGYIESLKEKGLYEHSIIFIMSDHRPNAFSLNMDKKNICAEIPMIILNSPVKFPYDKSKIVNQIDVFPTIADIMNIQSEWRGVGKSLMMPDSIRETEREQNRTRLEQEISESIIWGQYVD